MPVVSYLGPATAGVMTGSVVVETIFGVPGIGTYFVNAALNRDYPLVMGVIIVYAVLILLLNLAVDLLYPVLDPKVRFDILFPPRPTSTARPPPPKPRAR